MVDDDVLVQQLAFTFLTGMDAAHAQALIERVGSLQHVMTLSAAELASLTQCKKFTAEARSKAMERAEKEARFIADHNIHPLFYTDAAYPKRLIESTGAPLMLYALGRCNLNASKVISVVGTRHATA
ncbi:MAG: DNA-processing protein DprA, partial [Muribaculaceae bacterium]|nr:DNA-processing protein DprA [Muribaculaceae bacterium]